MAKKRQRQRQHLQFSSMYSIINIQISNIFQIVFCLFEWRCIKTNLEYSYIALWHIRHTSSPKDDRYQKDVPHKCFSWISTNPMVKIHSLDERMREIEANYTWKRQIFLFKKKLKLSSEAWKKYVPYLHVQYDSL